MLTGNAAHPVRNTAGRDDGEHAYVYHSSSFPSFPSIGLTHGGLVLIALLRGGDYAPEGLPGCGPGTAHALAKAGFGDTLLQAAKTLPKEKLSAFLDAWRDEVRAELKSNSRGLLGSKKAALAKSFPDTFPDPVVLSLYANPLTSESTNRPCALSYKWEREPDLGKLAALCERKFEWGVRPLIVKRFRTVIWEPMVLRILRRACLDLDSKECGSMTTTTTMTTPERRERRVRGSESEGDDGVRLPPPSGTPSKMIARHFSSLTLDSPSRQCRRGDRDSNSDSDASDAERLILKIHSKREHASTDGIPEYRLEVAPAQLVRLTEAGILGTRPLPRPAGSAQSQSQSALFYTGDDDDEAFAFDDDDDDDDDDDSAGGKSKGAKAKRRKPPPDPASHMRMWMPACMVERVEPVMVREFEEKEARKREKKGVKGVKAKAATSADASGKGVGIAGAKSTSKAKAKAKAATKTKGKKPAASATEEEEEEEETLSAPEDFSDVFGLVAGPGPGPKGKAKGKSSDAASRGRGRAKAKALPVTCEEEEDDDDDDVTPVKLKPRPLKVTKSKSKPVFVDPDPDPDPESSRECPPPPPPTSSQRSALLDALDSSQTRSANPGPGPSSSHASSSSARSSASTSTSTSTSNQPTQTQAQTRELRPFPIFFDSSDVNPAWPSSSSSLVSTEGRGGPEKRSTRMRTRTRTPSTSSASASSSSSTTSHKALNDAIHRSPRKSPRTSRLQESPKSRGRSRIPSMTLPRPTMSTSTSAKQNLPPNFDDADDAAKKRPAEKLVKVKLRAGAGLGVKPLLAARARTQTQARNDVSHGAPTQRQTQKSREIISLILDDDEEEEEDEEDEDEGEGYLDSWKSNRDGRAGSPTPTRPRPQRRQEVQLIVISSSEEDDDEGEAPPPPRRPPRGTPQTQSKPEPALPHQYPSTTQLPKPKPKPKPRPVAPVETNTSGNANANANANARIDSLFRVSKPRAKAINIASAVGGKPIVKPDGTQNAKAQARERARVPLASVNMSEVIDLD